MDCHAPTWFPWVTHAPPAQSTSTEVHWSPEMLWAWAAGAPTESSTNTTRTTPESRRHTPRFLTPSTAAPDRTANRNRNGRVLRPFLLHLVYWKQPWSARRVRPGPRGARNRPGDVCVL